MLVGQVEDTKINRAIPHKAVVDLYVMLPDFAVAQLGGWRVVGVVVRDELGDDAAARRPSGDCS